MLMNVTFILILLVEKLYVCRVCRTLRANRTRPTKSKVVVSTPQLRTSKFVLLCALVAEGSNVASRTAKVHHSSHGGHNPHLNLLAPPPFQV